MKKYNDFYLRRMNNRTENFNYFIRKFSCIYYESVDRYAYANYLNSTFDFELENNVNEYIKNPPLLLMFDFISYCNNKLNAYDLIKVLLYDNQKYLFMPIGDVLSEMRNLMKYEDFEILYKLKLSMTEALAYSVHQPNGRFERFESTYDIDSATEDAFDNNIDEDEILF